MQEWDPMDVKPKKGKYFWTKNMIRAHSDSSKTRLVPCKEGAAVGISGDHIIASPTWSISSQITSLSQANSELWSPLDAEQGSKGGNRRGLMNADPRFALLYLGGQAYIDKESSKSLKYCVEGNTRIHAPMKRRLCSS